MNFSIFLWTCGMRTDLLSQILCLIIGYRFNYCHFEFLYFFMDLWNEYRPYIIICLKQFAILSKQQPRDALQNSCSEIFRKLLRKHFLKKSPFYFCCRLWNFITAAFYRIPLGDCVVLLIFLSKCTN